MTSSWRSHGGCPTTTASRFFAPTQETAPIAAIALERHHQISTGYAFDRKEAKDHGDGGKIVGSPIKDGDKIVLVEDVITAGTTLSEVVPFLRNLAKVEITGVIIAVDRCEKLSTNESARAETERKLGIKVHPIITVHDIIGALESGTVKVPNSPALVDSMRSYLSEYGAG